MHNHQHNAQNAHEDNMVLVYSKSPVDNSRLPKKETVIYLLVSCHTSAPYRLDEPYAASAWNTSRL